MTTRNSMFRKFITWQYEACDPYNLTVFPSYYSYYDEEGIRCTTITIGNFKANLLHYTWELHAFFADEDSMPDHSEWKNRCAGKNPDIFVYVEEDWEE